MKRGHEDSAEARTSLDGSSGSGSSDGEFSSFLEVLRTPSAPAKDSSDANVCLADRTDRTGLTAVSDDDDAGTDDAKGAHAAVVLFPDDDDADENANDDAVRNGRNNDAVRKERGDDADEPPEEWRRRDMHLEFVSLLLFLVGSVLYMVLAVEDHHWAHKLLGMPMYVRIADDDVTWYGYQYERKYEEAFGKQEAAIDEGDAASNASDARAGNATGNATGVRMLEERTGGRNDGEATSRAGGVRMMMTRELWKLEEEISEEEARRNARELFGLQETATRANRAGERARKDVAWFSKRRLNTPEELYYVLCWAALPPEIQDAYTVLGSNEEVWDNGGETELSAQLADSWWQELADEQREAAELIGYTMEMWNVDENGNPISPPAPTAEPMVATDSPTQKPVTNSPTKEPTLKPVTDSPTRRPTPRPVTNDPTARPTPRPVTGSPTKRTTPMPVTMSPTKRPTQPPIASTSPVQETQGSDNGNTNVLYWFDLTSDQRYSLSMMGYTETSWNSGNPTSADLGTWSELTNAQQFGAFFLGFDAESWNGMEAGGHFAYRPTSSDGIAETSIVGDGANSVQTAPAPTSSSPTPAPSSAPTIVTTPPTTGPTGKPTGEPTSEPTKAPTDEPSSSPSSSPTLSPVTSVPTSGSPVAATILINVQSPTSLVTAEETSASVKDSESDAASGVSPQLPSTDATAAKPTPEELYYDEFWKDLPPEIQDAYGVLGLNETAWNLALPTETDDLWWHELSVEQRQAALFIGYTEEIWCATVQPTTSPTPPRVAQIAQSPAAGVVPAESTPVLPVSPPSSDTGEEEMLVPLVDFGSNPAPALPSTSNTPGTVLQAPMAPTPEELYYDEFWADLPPEIQDAYGKLGFNETAWNLALPTKADDYWWHELPQEMKEAAIFIGYTEQMWCATVAPTISPGNGTGVSVFNAPGSDADGVTNAATVRPGYYDIFAWSQLPPHIKDAGEVLGYDQNIWDNGGVAWSDEYGWDELPPEARQAGALFGYDKFTWDGVDPLTGAAVVETAASDDWIVYDDDYLFPVGSAEADIWVSKYQIIYFFAALSFLIVGVLDLIREKDAFHVLMIVAGALGVLSAVFIEADIIVSNILSGVSVHFYLLEFIVWFRKHKELGAALEGYEMWMKRAYQFADWQLVVGGVIDVILSYIYLFDHTSDWDVSLTVVFIAAAIMWVNCALIYMGLFVYEAYEYHEEKKNASLTNATTRLSQSDVESNGLNSASLR